jgi:hypothetical protein
MATLRAWAGMMRISILSRSLRSGGLNMLSPCSTYAPIKTLTSFIADKFSESGFDGHENFDPDLLFAIVQKYG